MNTFAQAETPPRKRSWWFYVKLLMLCLFLAAAIGVIGLFLYARSLVNRYTSTTAKPVAAAQFSPERVKELEARWGQFVQAIQDGQKPAPFEITADDLNLALARNKDLRDRLQFIISSNQLFLDFSMPLGQVGVKQLAGRFVNGTAKLDLKFGDGRFDIEMAKLDANGNPIPGWLLKQVQELMAPEKEKAMKDLRRNPNAAALLQEIQSVGIQNDKILLSPRP